MTAKLSLALALSMLLAATGWASAARVDLAIAEERVTASTPSVQVGLWADPFQADPPPTSPVWPQGPCREKSSRSQVDRPDLVDGEQVHIVYLVPSDMEDEELDTNGVLQCSVRSWNQWFEEQSGGQSWRLDTFDPRGRRDPLVDITYIRSSRPSSEIQNNADVEAELIKAGLANPVDYGAKKFLSYVATDTGGMCGSAQYPLAQFEAVGLARGWTRMASVYLFSDPACGARDFGMPGAPSWSESIAIHELIHTEGVVPLGAPHGCTAFEAVPTHICTPGVVLADGAGTSLDPERADVMFPFGVMPLSDNVLDRNNDDYFDHELPLRDLADSPWLIRSSRN